MPGVDEANTSAAGGATIAMDDDGDLTLVVGSGDTTKATFLVCSRTLSRSTPVFKAMLYGPFRESRLANTGAEPWTVELPDDLPAPATILLNITHGRFKELPTKFDTVHPLYEVLAFADKYDMTVLLAPWLQAWVSSLSPLQNSLFQDTFFKITAPWTTWDAVVVSRELGAVGPLKTIIKSVIMNAQANPTGELIYYGYRVEPSGSTDLPLSSPDIFENASSVRLQILTTIFKRLRTMVLGLQRVIPEKEALFCKHRPGYDSVSLATGPGSDVCHSMTLGFIISALGHAELKLIWAEAELLPDLLKQYSPSIFSLVYKIKSIQIIYAYSHAHCNPLPALTAEIDTIVASDKGRLADETLAYLERKRAQYGELDFSGTKG